MSRRTPAPCRYDRLRDTQEAERLKRDPELVYVNRRARGRRRDRLKAQTVLARNSGPLDDPEVVATAARMLASICPFSGLPYNELEQHVVRAATDAVRAKRNPRMPWR